MNELSSEPTPLPIFRRFIPIGTKEEMDRLHSLVEEKSLSRKEKQ